MDCRLPALILAISLQGFAGAVFAAQPAPPVALTVTAVTVQSANVPRTLAVTGSIHAWQEIVIGPEVGGYRVDAVQVDVGDVVKRGQELIRLSDSLLRAEAASRRAALTQAEAQLANAEVALQRAEALSTSAAFSKADVDRLRSEFLAARGGVDAAKADLDLAELRVQYTRVTAPHDGVITARTVNVGQVAQAGSEMLRLLRDGRVEWRGEVPEARLKELQVGQVAKLSTADGATITGKVRIVAPTVTSSSRQGLVYVDLDRGSGARPGMFARGVIEIGIKATYLAPLAGLVSQDGYSYAFVLGAGDKVQRRRVETGAIHGENIEIVSGIEAGERIVGRGAAFLKDGDQVRVVGS